MLWTIITILLLLYAFIDVSYFVRIIFTYVVAKYFRKSMRSLEASEVYGMCIPSDADFFLNHMNNSRFLREHDFARFNLFVQSGMFQEMLKRGAGFPLSAVTIRYRQPLMMFSLYKVVTTPVWWDAKFLYLDQRIITLSDDIVRSVAFSKLALLNMDVEAFLEEMFPGCQKPEMGEDLKKWIEVNDLSSDKMKRETSKKVT